MFLFKSPLNVLRVVALSLLACFGAFCGLAIAQTIIIPQVGNVGTGDLFQDVVNGIPQAPGYYSTAAQIAGVPGYNNLGVITTGNTYTFGNATTNMIAQPSGTLAAVTLTASANPGDGQTNCFLSTQTTTSLTWNANSTVVTQSISGAPTAGVANTKYCMLWNKANATWYRVQ